VTPQLLPSTAVAQRPIGTFRSAVIVAAAMLALSTPALAFGSRNDIIATLNPNNATISAATNGTSLPLQLLSGFVALQTNTPTCVASVSHPCSYIVNTVNMRLADFAFDGNTVNTPDMLINGPINVVDKGAGLVIPQGTPALTTGFVNETGFFTLMPTPAPVTITIDAVAQKAEVIGSFAIDITVFGQPVHATATYMIAANSPFFKAPTCPSVTNVPQGLLGFESLNWTTTGATKLAIVSAPITQGCHAMSVSGQGYIPITGPQFSTTQLTPTTAALGIDVLVPANQPNPAYFGVVQLYLSCPSANFNNQYIGQAALTGLPVGQYSTLRYPVPAPILSVLKASHPDCFFNVNPNINATPTPMLIDNLRFVQ
jgi:hypothetical protein